jgi:hypothetical protein
MALRALSTPQPTHLETQRDLRLTFDDGTADLVRAGAPLEPIVQGGFVLPLTKSWSSARAAAWRFARCDLTLITATALEMSCSTLSLGAATAHGRTISGRSPALAVARMERCESQNRTFCVPNWANRVFRCHASGEFFEKHVHHFAVRVPPNPRSAVIV